MQELETATGELSKWCEGARQDEGERRKQLEQLETNLQECVEEFEERKVENRRLLFEKSRLEEVAAQQIECQKKKQEDLLQEALKLEEEINYLNRQQDKLNCEQVELVENLRKEDESLGKSIQRDEASIKLLEIATSMKISKNSLKGTIGDHAVQINGKPPQKEIDHVWDIIARSNKKQHL